MSKSSESNVSPIASKLERFFKIKILALFVAFLLLLSGTIAVILGAKKIVDAILIITGVHEGKPGIYLIESVDTFLFAIVILIMGGGIFKLFVGDENTMKDSRVFAQIHSFKDLKVLLWETLLLTLTVWCSLRFFHQPDELNYKQLILPGSIVLLALALKLIMGKNHQ